ncbi:DMT family transporter [Candidatus Dojkabacteria bacterium]|uniref:DMT family transporter n=1 Tax=Candidatus Dojkabacteria bacterium TaxID=2099670 RepID=A0A955L8C9_9BACT|nr:DMT family transporter [Candidatus Dojkabacteria bacterium]
MNKLISHKTYTAAFLMCISIAFYGVYTGIQKQGLAIIQNPFEFAGYTMIYSSLFLFVPALSSIKKEPIVVTKKFLAILVTLSLTTQFIALSLKLFALTFTTATSVGIVSSFASVILAIYAVIITKESLSKGFWGILTLMCVGLLLFNTEFSNGVSFTFGTGELLVFLFINITSISNAFVKNFTKHYPPALLSFGRMFFAIPALLLTAYVTHGLHLEYLFNPFAIGAGFLFAFRNLFYYMAIKLTKLSNIAIINIFTPVVTFIYAYIFIDERISFVQTIGFAFITMGAFLHVRDKYTH